MSPVREGGVPLRHDPVAAGIALFLTLALVGGCVSLRETAGKGPSKPDRIIAGVPFFPQEAFQCGPASLAGVLNYWGVSADPEEIAGEVYSRSARGTLGLDLLVYAQKRGLDAYQYSGGIDDLKGKIDQGYPLVVLVDYGFAMYQVNHFMVVIGYGSDTVVVNSDTVEKRVIRIDDLIRAWEKTKFWTLLVKRP